MVGLDSTPEMVFRARETGIDFPDPAADLAEWAGGEVVWEADDLAVVSATYK